MDTERILSDEFFQRLQEYNIEIAEELLCNVDALLNSKLLQEKDKAIVDGMKEQSENLLISLKSFNNN